MNLRPLRRLSWTDSLQWCGIREKIENKLKISNKDSMEMSSYCKKYVERRLIKKNCYLYWIENEMQVQGNSKWDKT